MVSSFPPAVLYRIGEKVDRFRLGDSVRWTSEDSNVRRGSAGVVIGEKDHMIIVDFGTRQYLLEAAELDDI